MTDIFKAAKSNTRFSPLNSEEGSASGSAELSWSNALQMCFSPLNSEEGSARKASDDTFYCREVLNCDITKGELSCEFVVSVL